jgi:hypothetical protein
VLQAFPVAERLGVAGLGDRDVDVADQSLLAGPVEEPDCVLAGRRAGSEPGVEVVLGERGEGGAALTQPAEEADGDRGGLLGVEEGPVGDWSAFGAVAELAEQMPAGEPVDDLAMVKFLDRVEFGDDPAFEGAEVGIAGGQTVLADEQTAEELDCA